MPGCPYAAHRLHRRVEGSEAGAHYLRSRRIRPARPLEPFIVRAGHVEQRAANFKDAARTLPVLLGEFTTEEAYFGGVLYQQRLVEEAEASGVDGWIPWAIGCGFAKGDWASREPLLYLSARMRELNQ